MQVLIEKACAIIPNDIVFVPVYNETFDRGVHCIGKVLSINPKPHPDIVEFTIKILAHCDNKRDDKYTIGVREDREIGIMRI